MGTAISLDIAGDLPHADRLADEAFAWLREVDLRFSTYRSDSEVSALRAGALRREDCSPDLRHVLDECARLWEATDGYFDAFADGRFDPSGYVKGWSVQVASDRLAAAGAADHCLNAGGDICVRGRPAPDRLWRIGVLDPWHRDSLSWVLELTDAAVATSGGYERGAHITDPRTGRPARDLASVTVVGPDLRTADAYATAAMAMGHRATAWLERLDGHEWAVLTADGRSSQSRALPSAEP
ncbi:FAD:protein FMN transferase [Catellatospora sp. TT07R-123]|uniref:FAD:protein FMN transferase n=1 Tax=Catellatospora sp. TT07R-123 TaxID=2733863 RepID=UPI001BB44F53|nr:FAD:protein FMN transferase [Catellatospora sp. TT07R-123]